METFESQIRRLVCERVRVALTEVVDWESLQSLRSTARMVDHFDEMQRMMVRRLVAEFPAILDERIQFHESYPENWWEAFKDRWFPEWLKRRYPVRFREIHIDRPVYKAVCPHLEIPRQGSHIEFLYHESQR